MERAPAWFADFQSSLITQLSELKQELKEDITDIRRDVNTLAERVDDIQLEVQAIRSRRSRSNSRESEENLIAEAESSREEAIASEAREQERLMLAGSPGGNVTTRRSNVRRNTFIPTRDDDDTPSNDVPTPQSGVRQSNPELSIQPTLTPTSVAL